MVVSRGVVFSFSGFCPQKIGGMERKGKGNIRICNARQQVESTPTVVLQSSSICSSVVLQVAPVVAKFFPMCPPRRLAVVPQFRCPRSGPNTTGAKQLPT